MLACFIYQYVDMMPFRKFGKQNKKDEKVFLVNALCVTPLRIKLGGLAKYWGSHHFFIPPPPANCVCGRVYCFHVVRPTDRVSVTYVTFCFLNILKNHRWNFIKFCKHIHMYKANTTLKKLRARGQYYWSYFPL